MKKPMLENIKTILKEWDSSDIIDAAFQAAEMYGEEPEWESIIGDMLDKISEKNIKKMIKDQGYETEEEFYDSLYEGDPDSVISYLEEYLSEKDIKDIVKSFPQPEEFEDYEEED